MGIHKVKGKWIAFCDLCFMPKRFETKEEALEWWFQHRVKYHRIVSEKTIETSHAGKLPLYR